MADKEKPQPDITTSLAAMADLATPMAVRVAATALAESADLTVAAVHTAGAFAIVELAVS